MLLVEYEQKGGNPTIHEFWSGDPEKEPIKKQKRPYFYVHAHDKIPIEMKVEEGYKTITGTPVKKMYVRVPSDVPKMRDKYRHFEADILFTDRYLIDEIQTPLPKLPIRRMVVDIEVDSEGEFEHPKTARKPILCMTTYIDRTYYRFVWHSKKKIPSVDKEIEDKIGKALCRTTGFKSERAMISMWIQLVQKSKPDMLDNWNMTGYDLPYLYQRSKILGLNIDLISPMRRVTWDLQNPPRVAGVVVFDLMLAYMVEKPNSGGFSLKFVYNDLGLGKLDEFGAITGKLYREGKIQKLLDYNLMDVVAVVEIDWLLEIVDTYDEIQRFVGCQFTDILNRARMSEIYIMRNTDCVWPSRPEFDEGRYAGVPPLETTLGLHEWIMILDVEGMHPNIGISYNLSPDTVDITPEGYAVSNTKKKGIMVKVIMELLRLKKESYQKRDSYSAGSDEWKNWKRKAECVKEIINTASYGLYGDPHSRMYHHAIAMTITKKCVEKLDRMNEVCTNLSYNVVAGDTDSVHVLSKFKAVRSILSEARKLAKILADELTKMSTHGGFNVEVDIIAKRGIYRAKKRYGLHVVWDNGPCDRIEIKGLEVKRGDFSKFTRSLQKDLIEMILRGRGEEDVKDYIISRKKEMRDLDIMDLALPLRVWKNFYRYTNPSPWVRAAMYSNEYLGGTFRPGSRVYLIYLNKQLLHGLPRIDCPICKGLGELGNMVCTECSGIGMVDTPKTNTMGLDESRYIQPNKSYMDAIDWQKMNKRNFYDPVIRVLDLVGMHTGFLEGQDDIRKWGV